MRKQGEAPRRQPHIALAIATGFVAFLLVTAWSQVRVQSKSAAGRKAELAELVATRQRHTDALERQLAGLKRQLGAASRANAGSELLSLENEGDRIASMAGTAPVRGPGIVVELADSNSAQSTDEGSADFQIQDVDMQLVVNALWEAGTEAIAINGQRVVGTTAIRSAGGAILVNYRVLTSPYRIEAVGDPSSLARHFSASAIAQRFRGWADVYHLGFSVKKGKALNLPAFSGSVRFQYAQPTAR